jgi:hypothetical protein
MRITSRAHGLISQAFSGRWADTIVVWTINANVPTTMAPRALDEIVVPVTNETRR